MAYDQLGRKQLASRIGHRIRSVEDYRKQITDLPFDEHFNNDVKQIATALEHLIQDNVRKERAKQEKSQKKVFPSIFQRLVSKATKFYRFH